MCELDAECPDCYEDRLDSHEMMTHAVRRSHLAVERKALRLENEQLREHLANIADLIFYQAHLKHQDRWLKTIIDSGDLPKEQIAIFNADIEEMNE